MKASRSQIRKRCVNKGFSRNHRGFLHETTQPQKSLVIRGISVVLPCFVIVFGERQISTSFDFALFLESALGGVFNTA